MNRSLLMKCSLDVNYFVHVYELKSQMCAAKNSCLENIYRLCRKAEWLVFFVNRLPNKVEVQLIQNNTEMSSEKEVVLLARFMSGRGSDKPLNLQILPRWLIYVDRYRAKRKPFFEAIHFKEDWIGFCKLPQDWKY